jgi:hypothetical protein
MIESDIDENDTSGLLGAGGGDGAGGVGGDGFVGEAEPPPPQEITVETTNIVNILCFIALYIKIPP